MFQFIAENFNEFLTYTGFANASVGNLIMIIVGVILIYLAIKKDFEPLLLVPIGLGIILGNIPFRADAGLCQTAARGRHPMGQQEIHEHEAPGSAAG